MANIRREFIARAPRPADRRHYRFNNALFGYAGYHRCSAFHRFHALRRHPEANVWHPVKTASARPPFPSSDRTQKDLTEQSIEVVNAEAVLLQNAQTGPCHISCIGAVFESNRGRSHLGFTRVQRVHLF